MLSKLKAEHKLQELIMRKMAPDIECYEWCTQLLAVNSEHRIDCRFCHVQQHMCLVGYLVFCVILSWPKPLKTFYFLFFSFHKYWYCEGPRAKITILKSESLGRETFDFQMIYTVNDGISPTLLIIEKVQVVIVQRLWQSFCIFEVSRKISSIYPSA